MKTSKQAAMWERIRQHGEDLKQVFGLGVDVDPLILCKRLRRIEAEANKWACDLCNGLISPTDDDCEIHHDRIIAKVRAALGDDGRVPIKINNDPRGYALKIPDTWVREHNARIHTDWGGYGILAPDLSND